MWHIRASMPTYISLSITASLFYFSCIAHAGPPARHECAHLPPGVIFCEDFEGQDPKANFNDYDGNLDTENMVVTQLGPAGDASNRAIRLRVPAGQGGTSDLIKVLPQTYDKLYARWYLRY